MKRKRENVLVRGFIVNCEVKEFKNKKRNFLMISRKSLGLFKSKVKVILDETP